MRRLILATAAVSIVLQTSAPPRSEAALGTGAIVGIGIAAAALGAIIGAEIADHLSERDQYAFRESYSRAYDARVGEPIEWRGDSCSGRIEVVRTGYWAKEPTTHCREVRNVIYDSQGNEIQNDVRTTCREEDHWVYVDSSELIEAPAPAPIAAPVRARADVVRVRGSYAPVPAPPLAEYRSRPALGPGWMPWEVLDGKYLRVITDPRTTDDDRLDLVDRINDEVHDRRLWLSSRQLFEILAPIRNEEQRFEALEILVKRTCYRASEILPIADLYRRDRHDALRLLRRHGR